MAHHLSGLGRLLQRDLPFRFLLGGIGGIQYTAGSLDGLGFLAGTVISSAIASPAFILEAVPIAGVVGLWIVW